MAYRTLLLQITHHIFTVFVSIAVIGAGFVAAFRRLELIWPPVANINRKTGRLRPQG
jgi:hypothetical protein